MATTINLVKRPRFSGGGSSAVWTTNLGSAAAVGGRDSKGNSIAGLNVTANQTGGVPYNAPHTEVVLKAGDILTVWVEGKLNAAAAGVLVAIVPTTATANPAAGTGASVQLSWPAYSSAYNTLTGTLTAPGTGTYLLRLFSLSGTMDVTGVRLSVMAEPDALGIFDGDTADTEELTYDWTGAALASTSTASTVEAPAPEPEPTPDPEPEPEPVAPMGQRIADFLGQGTNPELVTMANQHSVILTAMAHAYTRGRGFKAGKPAADIEAVITTATARMLANPEQAKIRAGDVSVDGGFTSWTLAELFVLNNYRRRAA